MKKIILILTILLITINNVYSKENIMIMKLKDGDVEIELYSKIAPNHVKRFETFANEGKYDGVVFHRVIDGFMAQTGDIKYGKSNSTDYNLDLAGTGGSDLPDLNSGILEEALEALTEGKTVFGPAQDGGYYLVGMQEMIAPIFDNKQWSTDNLLEDTLAELKSKSIDYKILTELNDVDTLEDLMSSSVSIIKRRVPSLFNP